MGKQSSKIKDFLYVNSQQFDPPHIYPPPGSSPKEIKIDYTKFIPKKFYKTDATDQQISKQLIQLDKKQSILKQFKYYKDFDRIDFRRMGNNVANFQQFCEQHVKNSVGISLICSRILLVQYSGEYFSNAGWFRLFWPFFLGSLVVIGGIKALLSPEYHIINHEYFRIMSSQMAIKTDFDLKYDIYQDVDDIKYNAKFPTVRQFYKVRRHLLQGKEDAKKGWYKEIFQYQNGLKLDPFEEFVKEREQKRKGSSVILTEQEKEQIANQMGKKSQ